MRAKDWKIKAIAEGRVCPECNAPQTIEAWKEMTKSVPTHHCKSCRYVHWEVPLGCYGSVRRDNADREDLDRMR
jgi:uncharacterized metal-binding protein (TIGR02443 family)